MDPLLAFGFWAFVLTFAGIYAIFVLGLQVEVGDTGLVNFGHVAFMAIGAYACSLLTIPAIPKNAQLPKLPGFIGDTVLPTVPAPTRGRTRESSCSYTYTYSSTGNGC